MKILAIKNSYKEWKNSFLIFFHFKLLYSVDIIKTFSLIITLVLFETITVTTFIPLFEFLQNKGNVVDLNRSIWFEYYMKVYNFLGIEPNILSFSVIIIISVSLRQFFNFSYGVYCMRLKHRVGKDIATKCFSGIFNSNPTYIQNFKTGVFVNTIDHQSQLAAMMVKAFCSIFQILITFLAYFLVMLVSAPYVSILSLIIMVLILASVEKYVRKAKSLSTELVNFRQKYIGFLNDRYRNWRAIKILGTELQETEQAAKFAKKFYKYGVNVTKNSGKNIVIVTPLMVTVALSILYLSVEVFNLSLANISIFILMLIRLVPVTQSFANQRAVFAQAQPSLNHIIKIFKEVNLNKENLDSGKNFKNIINYINVQNVNFSYNDNKESTLKNIKCLIPAQKMTAILGKSGSGKSTFTDLIIGLRKPDSGKIYFDNLDQNAFSLNSIRKNISYVSQQPLIFSGTILDNIKYSNLLAKKEDIINAAKEANAHNFISELPNDYNFILEEAGGNISGGERQRIMLARAFLKKNKLIILDEATSSVDIASEEEINDALKNKIKKDKLTVIVIAHRVSTIKMADHIIIFEKGSVIDQGIPDKLDYNDKWYHSMLDNIEKDKE